eukprot:gb/GECH01002832.1/.p1 GENE.gb/GECH01002832.1/~~gb/GECH01002832.1/.p1  ORF type:complete len:186 (+),score=72.66 gb/GECH01002832.1/:1-558(+)
MNSNDMNENEEKPSSKLLLTNQIVSLVPPKKSTMKNKAEEIKPMYDNLCQQSSVESMMDSNFADDQSSSTSASSKKSVKKLKKKMQTLFPYVKDLPGKSNEKFLFPDESKICPTVLQNDPNFIPPFNIEHLDFDDIFLSRDFELEPGLFQPQVVLKAKEKAKKRSREKEDSSGRKKKRRRIKKEQ